MSFGKLERGLETSRGEAPSASGAWLDASGFRAQGLNFRVWGLGFRV